MVDIFENHVRQSVPGYADMQKLVVGLSDFFIDSESTIYDIGSSLGNTVFDINSRHKEKSLKFIGIDNSTDMVAKANIKKKGKSNIDFICDDIREYSFPYRSNLTIAILSLQFLGIEDRREVIERIYDNLKVGGAFIIIEKTYSASAKSQDIFTQLYHDFKQTSHLSTNEIRQKDISLRSKLNSIELNSLTGLLQNTGFTTEVFYKYLNFTGILCIK